MVNKPPRSSKDIFEIGQYLMGMLILGVGLYTLVVQGKDINIFIWGLGGALIGSNYVKDWLNSKK